jgi:hypothetical protein
MWSMVYWVTKNEALLEKEPQIGYGIGIVFSIALIAAIGVFIV